MNHAIYLSIIAIFTIVIFALLICYYYSERDRVALNVELDMMSDRLARYLYAMRDDNEIEKICDDIENSID